jgi:hypothetical protein
MLVRKIPCHFPNTLAVLISKCRPIWVFDDFKYCFIDDLKPVAYQWRFETIAGDCNVLVRTFWQLHLCGKRLEAINRHSRKRPGRALRVDTRERGDGQKQSKTESFHVTSSMRQLASNAPFEKFRTHFIADYCSMRLIFRAPLATMLRGGHRAPDCSLVPSGMWLEFSVAHSPVT